MSQERKSFFVKVRLANTTYKKRFYSRCTFSSVSFVTTYQRKLTLALKFHRIIIIQQNSSSKRYSEKLLYYQLDEVKLWILRRLGITDGIMDYGF